MTTPLGGAHGDVIDEVHRLAAELDGVIQQLWRSLDAREEDGDDARPDGSHP